MDRMNRMERKEERYLSRSLFILSILFILSSQPRREARERTPDPEARPLFAAAFTLNVARVTQGALNTGSIIQRLPHPPW
jgi:hypothetical protein